MNPHSDFSIMESKHLFQFCDPKDSSLHNTGFQSRTNGYLIFDRLWIVKKGIGFRWSETGGAGIGFVAADRNAGTSDYLIFLTAKLHSSGSPEIIDLFTRMLIIVSSFHLQSM